MHSGIQTQLSAMTTPEQIGQFVTEERLRLMKSWRSMGGVGFMHRHSDLVDAAIGRVFDLAVHETEKTIGRLSSDLLSQVCLAATGGYGRRELCPFSDVDVAFVTSDDDNAQLDMLVKNAYRILMDVFLGGTDLKIGYSYRQLGECHDLPVDTHTALLDARRIAGSKPVYDRFMDEVFRSVIPAAFLFEHLQQRKCAAARLGPSPHRVEPNIKEGVGGLRDLHTARWIAQVVFGSRDDVWKSLRSRGIVSEADIHDLHSAVEYLARVRLCLHASAGRSTDLLSVERQEQIAPSLGYRRGAAPMMSGYYASTEVVHRLYTRVVSACREQPLEIEPGIAMLHDRVHVNDMSLFLRKPDAMIRVFGYAVSLGLEVGRETGELLRASIVNGIGRKRPESVYREFMGVLANPSAHMAIQLMSEHGVLQWLFPEFRKLMYQVPGDAAHELTVGAHSLKVVSSLGEMSGCRASDLYEVWSGLQEPELLFLAALLHDIGKSEDGDHCERGAHIARDICTRLGLSTEASDIVEFLVRNHVVMGETARLRDLNDPRAVDEFVKTLPSHEMLDLLYLLTAADLRSVGQNNWGEVQMRFLRELYHRVGVAMRRQGQPAVDVERHRTRLTRELSLSNVPREEIEEHCRLMPASYLLNTSPDELAAHILLVRQAREGKPAVAAKDDPSGRLTEITICVQDDPEPGLLARIAGALHVLGVDIHAAQVFTRENGDRIAIDTLFVDFNQHALPELKRLQVQSELVALLAHETDLLALFARFGRSPTGSVQPVSIQIMSHVSDRHSVVQVEADDQPGLLYLLTRGISSLRWNIHSARINTWGGRAQDAFYVTDSSGRKLDADTARTALAKALQSRDTDHRVRNS